ncbi:MAG: hemerythrin domain-containing protein [Novosphingobium sp.]|nr:hemerythrin domain-containing protein [Novosphingobium sp.]
MAKGRIFDDLIADHQRQRELIAQVMDAPADGEKRGKCFEQLRIELQAHAAAEEETLYATMLADPELREDARHSVAEHKEIDDLLGELVETDLSSPGWIATFKKLCERYLHHIDEEEREMFPAAAKRLTLAEEERLGRVFERRKPRELEHAEAHPPGDERE